MRRVYPRCSVLLCAGGLLLRPLSAHRLQTRAQSDDGQQADTDETDGSFGADAEPFPGPPVALDHVGSTFYFPPTPWTAPTTTAPPPDKTVTVRLLSNAPYALDASRPPLSPAEVERVALTRATFSSPFAPLNRSVERPCLLLSPDAIVYQLGPEMEAIDATFRQKGFYTPSEVAQAFVAVTPTYYIETRHLFTAVSPAILYALEQRFTRPQLVSQFLSWYPMVFTLKRTRMQKTVVKLNTDMWFIRAHPDFKKGDRLQFRHNAEYNVAVGGVLSKHVPERVAAVPMQDSGSPTAPGAQDAEMSAILIRHLPRLPTTAHAGLSEAALEAKRCAPVKLVDWINSFPQDAIDALNRVPQHHVVQLLQRYHGIFQLMCLNGEEPLLFTPKETFKTAPESRLAFVATMEASLPEEHNTSASLSPSAPSPRVVSTEDARTVASPLRAPWEEDLEKFAEAPFTDEPADDTESEVACGNFDVMYIRRRPKSIAPHALSDFGLADSPLPDIALVASQLLAPPPSMADPPLSDSAAAMPQAALSADGTSVSPASASASTALTQGRRRTSTRHPGAAPTSALWRWISVDRVYQSLTRAQRQALRPYKGLVNFLRLHGTVFELSEDMQHVIAHDPAGLLAPLVPTQRTFHFESRVTLPDDFDDNPTSTASLAGTRERELFQHVLGKSQIPTTRRQVLLLDPHNPVLFHDVLYEEVANTMPDGPMSVNALVHSLPPILRAALPRHVNFGSSRFFITWEERGLALVQRSDAGKPERMDVAPCTVEEAIEAIYTVIPEGGVTVRALTRLYLSVPEAAALTTRFGTVLKAVLAFPQFFDVVRSPAGSPGDALIRPRE